MKNSTVFALILSGLVATTSISSFAGPERGHGDFGPMPMMQMKSFRGLDLTDAQKDQIKVLMEQHRATMPKSEGMKAEMNQLKTLVQADSFDEAAVRALLESKQKDRLDHEVARAKLQFDINKVLTPEQRTKLAERQSKWQEKMHEKMADKS